MWSCTAAEELPTRRCCERLRHRHRRRRLAVDHLRGGSTSSRGPPGRHRRPRFSPARPSTVRVALGHDVPHACSKAAAPPPHAALLAAAPRSVGQITISPFGHSPPPGAPSAQKRLIAPNSVPLVSEIEPHGGTNSRNRSAVRRHVVCRRTAPPGAPTPRNRSAVGVTSFLDEPRRLAHLTPESGGVRCGSAVGPLGRRSGVCWAAVAPRTMYEAPHRRHRPERGAPHRSPLARSRRGVVLALVPLTLLGRGPISTPAS